MEAGKEADTPRAEIAKPKLVVRGVEMTLASANGRVFYAGDEPAFELTAINTANQPASVTVGVSVSCSAMQSAFSRMLSAPRILWQQEQFVTLDPKETKVTSLHVQTNLPPDSLVSVSLREVNAPGHGTAPGNPQLVVGQPRGVVAMSFSTAPAKAPSVANVVALSSGPTDTRTQQH
jgi:hypothetical protein